jgi:hypothetical protein
MLKVFYKKSNGELIGLRNSDLSLEEGLNLFISDNPKETTDTVGVIEYNDINANWSALIYDATTNTIIPDPNNPANHPSATLALRTIPFTDPVNLK